MRGLTLLVIKRFLITVPVLVAVVTLVFFLIHVVPGDPAQMLAGENATEEQIQTIRHDLGLDKPVLTQYLDYWKGLVGGDWGENPVSKQKVLSRIASRYPGTIRLAVVATLLAVLISIPLGVTAATHKGSFID